MESFQLKLQDGSVVTCPAFIETKDKKVVPLRPGTYTLADGLTKITIVEFSGGSFVNEIKPAL